MRWSSNICAPIFYFKNGMQHSRWLAFKKKRLSSYSGEYALPDWKGRLYLQNQIIISLVGDDRTYMRPYLKAYDFYLFQA